MFTNTYIDEITFWEYDRGNCDYVKTCTKRSMSLNDLFMYIERLTSVYAVKYRIDAMDPDYTLASVYMR